jgi:hypothetical protein
MEGIDEATILAAQEQRHASRQSSPLAELVRRQEAARRPEPDEAARRSAEAFERDLAEIAEQSRLELGRLDRRWPPDVEQPVGADDSGPKHVFAPGAGAVHPYKYEAAFTGGGHGYADANKETGVFFAGTTTNDDGASRTAVAQVGVQLKPAFQHCRLRVRPVVQWTGFDHMGLYLHIPSSYEPHTATALGSTGIAIESWDETGGSYLLEPIRWSDEWRRVEANPGGQQSYEGVAGPISGLEAETIALGARWYAIWILCRLHVSATSGSVLSTWASGGISAKVPYFVIEEVRF